MTESSTHSADPSPVADALEAHATSDTAITDFGIDTTSKTPGEAVRDYWDRLRGGELGAVPALLGLLLLVIIFSVLSDKFLTIFNVSNLLQQGAGQTIIAIGIVPVLLLGEIDLSAGTASGVTATLLALHFRDSGNLQHAMGDALFYAFVIGLVVAAALAALMRLWPGVIGSLIAVALMMLGVPANPWLEMLLAITVGVGIGCLTGFLVSKIGIPSFVVTLGLFIAWYGVVLQLVGGAGSVSTGEGVVDKIANASMSISASWVLFIVACGGYAAVVASRHMARLRKGLVAQPTMLVAIKIGAVVVLGAVATFMLTTNRSLNPTITTLSGVPYVVPIVLALFVAGTFVLDRTRYGRHIYAVGGNSEAARRAGVNVPKIRMSVFIICSGVAAMGAIVYTSKLGSVDGNAGGGNTLLFAVGAAVIGGTSLFGGRGRIRDAVLGGLVLATVQNGLDLLGFQAAPVNIITGLVLLLAASVDALSRRRAAAR